MSTQVVDVSICMITYNHGSYIETAINSILNQDFRFNYELIIADDCSNDDTSNIIIDIIGTHPSGKYIKYSRHKENIGMFENFFFTTSICQGKYIAFCEGDDYWNDMSKLQLQYDFLELNQDVSMLHSDYNVLNQEMGLIHSNHNINKVIITGNVYQDLIKDNFIATLTVMIRSEDFKEAAAKLKPILHGKIMLDYPFWLYISSQHKIGYLPTSLATYRLLSNSASHSKNLLQNLRFLKHTFDIRLLFHRKIKNISKKNLKIIYKIFFSDLLVYNLNAIKRALGQKKRL